MCDTLVALAPATAARATLFAKNSDRGRNEARALELNAARAGTAVHRLTGSSAPCSSVFKPGSLGAGLSDQGAAPSERYDGADRWWRHERAHRAALSDYPGRIAAFPMRDTLEQSFRDRIDRAIATDLGASRFREEVDACWREADAAEARWSKALAPATRGGDYEQSWARLSELAGLG